MDCTPEKFRRVQCHQDQSICFQGNGSMTFGERLGGCEGLGKACGGRARLTGRHGPGLKKEAWSWTEGGGMALV